MPDPATTPAPMPPAAKTATLDDLMIAMDVVDTLRHRDDLVRRELNEEDRQADLIQRLREIYRLQGIEVPDSVLAVGVKALKDSRFTYTPPPASLKRTALEMWTRRQQVGKWAGGALGALILAWGYHYYTVSRPAQLAETEARVEVTETLPTAIRTAHADVARIATDQPARQKADQLLADGERAIRDKDRAALARIKVELDHLRTEVAGEYTLTIVSRPGETTGVWRRPPAGSTQRNYYIIVEAVSPAGSKLKLPIRNEENGRIEEVDKFGVRVPQTTFDSVAADKRDDGIVQNNRFGVKRRGKLDVDWQMPYGGGMITRW